MASAAFLLIGVGAWAWFARPDGRQSGAGRAGELSSWVTSGDAKGFNVVLITLDTVRADRLGTYGFAAAETPSIDALVNRGVRFEEASAPAPITLPSHATMLTGLYPPRHGVRDNGLFRLADEQVTLAEHLQAQGYETAAFVGCFVLDRRYGLSQGFDTYDFEVDAQGFQPSNFDFNQRSAGAVTDAAIAWLQNRKTKDRPFFLWAHYFDAHVPYQSPLGKLARFADRGYDAEIAYVDQELGRLFAELDRNKLRERTLIALVSDHGEGLNEHGESTHGLFVYESTMRVAFLLSCPKLFRGAHSVNNRIVSLADLRPTLEDLLGLPSGAPMDGQSLLQASEPDRAVYIETKMPFHAARCSPLYGLRRLGDKYIEAPEPEYYDLKSDPGEMKNLIRDRSDDGNQLAARLQELRKSWPNPGGEEARGEMTAEDAERLRSLGYVQTAGGVESESLPDPKAMMRASRLLGSAHRLQRERRTEEAIRDAREAVRECPGYPDATALLAQLCIEADRPEEAIQALEECLRINPIPGMALQLAQTYLVMRRFSEMEHALQTAARMEPDNGFIHVLRGDRYSIEGRIPEARSEYEKALEVDEHRVGVLVRPALAKLGGSKAGT
jgi:arylsulfatase A-like enzyme/Flp pilus assembly protein TadD